MDNRITTHFIMAFVVLLVIFTPTYAHAIFSYAITVGTDKTEYQSYEPVIVYGEVAEYLMKTGEPVSIHVFNPNGNEYRFDRVNVTRDGIFTYGFKFQGELALPGYYEILVTSGTEQAATVITNMRNKMNPEDYHTYVVKVDDNIYPIRYKLTEGHQLMWITPYVSDRMLVIVMDSKADNGQLTIELPRNLIDAQEDGSDITYSVSAGGYGEVVYRTDAFYEVNSTSDKRTLVIDKLSNNISEIVIHGTHMVPEFPVNLMIIAGIGLIGALVALKLKVKDIHV